jgi:membrane fusion protein (multidrug efflux system)
VSIKDENGGQLGNAQNTVYQTDVFAKYGDEADAEIARIIAENAGPNAGTHKAAQSGSSKPASAKLM